MINSKEKARFRNQDSCRHQITTMEASPHILMPSLLVMTVHVSQPATSLALQCNSPPHAAITGSLHHR